MMKKSLTLRKRKDSAKVLAESAIEDSIVTVGSDPGASIELCNDGIAPEQFIVVAEGYEIVLMNRAKGTMLNGDKLKPGARVALTNGDVIEVKDFVVLFDSGASEARAGEAPGLERPEIARAAAVSGGTTRKEAGAATGQPEMTKSPEPEKPVKERDFSKILYELKDEDTFYFHIRDTDDVIQRVPLVRDQMWIGTKLGNVVVNDDENAIDKIFARVNKDWSGVVVYPRSDHTSLLNGEKLVKPERLRNEDKLRLVDDFETRELDATISFHEPVSLLALSSILPGELPEPVSPKSNKAETVVPVSVRKRAPAGAASLQSSTEPRLILGYYTILEVLIMTFGTLVTAAIIFFVLEFV